jgi:hypothetical protein
MTTKQLRKSDKQFLAELGDRVKRIILRDMGYCSLDAFSLEHHDLIAKPTLYQIADGKRDMKLSTLRRLADTLGISLKELISGL